MSCKNSLYLKKTCNTPTIKSAYVCSDPDVTLSTFPRQRRLYKYERWRGFKRTHTLRSNLSVRMLYKWGPWSLEHRFYQLAIFNAHLRVPVFKFPSLTFSPQGWPGVLISLIIWNKEIFQLNDSRCMWQGLKTICSSGNNPSAEVRADPLLAEELNTFYGRFECNGGATLPISASGSSRQSSDVDHVITVSEDEVRRELRRVNIRKAAGPDGITGCVLRSCADQLAGLFTSIFNESLATSVIPTSFKKSVIIPVPKNSKPSCLNDYRPVALTSTVMKVFERLLKKHIWSSIPATLDPLQFAYRPNRSTDDAISQVLHSSLTHIDSKNGNYVRLLFIDYSSAFNTIVRTKLAVKLSDLGLNTSLCDWIQDFLTGRPQVVKMGQFTSNSITLNVGAPQGCVLSPLLYSLYTHDCVSSLSSTSIVKFADDTVVLGLISNNDETAYLGEVERLTSWCQDNCLSLNVSKTKELIVDFRKR